MSFELTHNAYGKSRVRLTKVVRDGARHTLFDVEVAVELEGDFAAAYTGGDNRNVIATDTIKNTVYVLAKRWKFIAIDGFAALIALHFVDTYPHVTSAKVELLQTTWKRIEPAGTPHDHAFVSGGAHRRFARAIQRRDPAGLSIPAAELTAGVRGLAVLKTTASEWRDFHTDEYRTLKDTTDRILATQIDADWTYNSSKSADTLLNVCYDDIVNSILTAFAMRHSLGVQQTLQQMGEAALAACDAIDSIRFTLPNMHRIPFNLEPFGLKFENDVYVSTDEPQGLIRGTISRGGNPCPAS